jgi:murein L,D-transpeptidase YafK
MRLSTAPLLLLLLATLCSRVLLASPLLPDQPLVSTVTPPIYIRLFKEERQLEIWQQSGTGHYQLHTTFRICHYSGLTGPKIIEGDRQSPEGFYSLTPDRMNPNSRFHLALDIGFPNKYDKAHGRTGSALMIHGDCVSKGCYAMTDRSIEEIYAIVESAFATGQQAVPIHIFPFRMNELNMAYYNQSPWISFWQEMRQGYQLFEDNRYPPLVEVFDGQYIISSGMARQLVQATEETLFVENR